MALQSLRRRAWWWLLVGLVPGLHLGPVELLALVAGLVVRAVSGEVELVELVALVCLLGLVAVGALVAVGGRGR